MRISGKAAKRSLKYCDILIKKCQTFWSIEKKCISLQKFSIEHERSKQETQSFRKIGDGFKRILIQNAPVVPWHDDDGILTISLTDFLLKQEALDW